MKKLIITLAIALSAQLYVQAQPVYSNIVGMVKHELPVGGIKIVALQFPENEDSVVLGNAFTNLGDNSVLYVWNANNTYIKYTYFDGFGWFDGGTNVDSVEIKQGTGLWLSDGGSGSSPVQSGNVPNAESFDVAIVAGLNMIANPYPVNLKFGDLDTSEMSDEDEIYAWNGTSYAKYTFFQGFGWFDGGTNVDETEIPAGQGFWLQAGVAGTITFAKPY